MSFRSDARIYREQRERRLRNDIYEECLTRAYIDALKAGMDIPGDGRIEWEDWPNTIQPYLERHMAEAIDRGWFDYGTELTKLMATCDCPWHYRSTALIVRRAWGEALIRVHCMTPV